MPKKGPTMKTLRSTLAARLVLACCSSASSPAPHATAIFVPNSQPTGWVGEVDVSSFDFSDGNQVIFKPDFIKGQLVRQPLRASRSIPTAPFCSTRSS